ncbi:hypothetical protein [Quadrisphaera granulorum]|uniref:hypothetical protein n=1 Tax=Quadrisphaera granulorum TaxID=317664 RepID=UPI000D6C1A0E|nr:hypothetical protein [Quadrisphaera granulorum]
MNTPTWIRVVSFVVSLGAFVLTRMMTRGLPWWLSIVVAFVVMLVAGRLAAIGAAEAHVWWRRRQERGAVTRS